jgi:outer membrane receptor protein involved in Fe transport
MREFKTRASTQCMVRAAIASVLLVSAPCVLGQTVSATLRGQVLADTSPATNATVTATNTATGFSRSVQTSASGTYSLAGLPPGEYRIDVSAGGQSTSQSVVLQVGQVATLNLQAGAVRAQSIESVTVTAERLYETKTSEVASYVSLRQIELLPQNSRNFLEFAETVPGVQFLTNSNGQTELRGGAQSANGVNVYIDGVGQKNYVTRGGVGGQGKLSDSAASNRGTRGNPFPQLAIGEYKVITSNYKAEFDQVSSAAIVAATRSGANEFEVEAFFDTTNEDWRAADPLEARAGGVKAKSEQQQYGVAVGGPIIRDRMHFFVTYEKKEIESPQRVFPLNWNGPIPDELAGILGNFSEPFDQDLFFAKIDLTLGDAHLLEFTAKYRDESETSFSDQEAPSYATVNQNEEGRYDLRYQYTGDFFLNDAHLTYEDGQFSPRPRTLRGHGFQLFNGGFDNNNFVLNLGAGNVYDDRVQQGWGFQDDLTFNAIEWLGTHTIKTGIKVKFVDLEVESRSPANPLYSVDINDPTLTPFRVVFGASRIGDLRVSSENRQYGIYIQDDWDVTERLQLNIGVRYDYEETPSYLDYVTPQNVLDALNSQNLNSGTEDGQDHRDPLPGETYLDTLRLGGLDISRFISTGNNRHAFDGGIAPRLGFSFDLTGDQRHVVFGGAGRSYDRNVFEYLARETTKGSFPRYEYWIDSPTDTRCATTPGCLAWDPSLYDQATLDALAAANPFLGAEVFLLDNELKTPYSDQFSLGIRNRFALGAHEWATSVTAAYVESHDGIVFILGQRWPDGTFRTPGTTWGGAPWSQHPSFNGTELGNLLLGTNGVKTRATQLLLSAQKPYTAESGWAATFAYTYTNAKENRLNTASEDETYVFDYATIDEFGWNTSTGVPRHRVVATALWDGPWGISFSSKLTLASPTPVATIPNCSQVTDPLLCYPDSKTPDTTLGFKQFDLALQKSFEFLDGFRVRVRADVLNVFNWENPDRRNSNLAAVGVANPPEFLRPETYLQPTRTFKLSLSANWR